MGTKYDIYMLTFSAPNVGVIYIFTSSEGNRKNPPELQI